MILSALDRYLEILINHRVFLGLRFSHVITSFKFIATLTIFLVLTCV